MSAQEIPDRPEGWAYLFNAPKWHYFVGTDSLCGKWMNLGTTREQGNDESPDNCKACRKKLAARRERNQNIT